MSAHDLVGAFSRFLARTARSLFCTIRIARRADLPHERHHWGMDAWAKLIEAIAHLVGAIVWPVAIVVGVRMVMRRHRDAFERLIDRVRSFSYPGGQVDLADLTVEQERQVERLVEQASVESLSHEEREKAVRQLMLEAERLGSLRLLSEADLTPLERVVLDLRTNGLSRDEIAVRLNLSKAQVSGLLRTSRAQLGISGELDFLHYLRRRNAPSAADTDLGNSFREPIA
ncbi:helix-turn-helix transcriptional regulator [Sphaerisporangium dianthi]|uniref:Helix-turn-helix transcriptional regulator n=1 Tax=Sphaerisporangium dianthi TaxID=1436120 RepID=A0ABV9CS91_9ACTN